MPKKILKNKGFTIIETLVAITILLMAIAGPLTIAEKGLTEAVSSQDQLTASYLAQDLMEYVKNVRDDNMLYNPSASPLPWLVSPNGRDLSTCTSGNSPCDFDTEAGNPTSPSFASCTVVATVAGNLCQIYLTSGESGYYSPDSTLSNKNTTKFSRAFTVALPAGTTASTATSSIVTVTVAWKTGTIANQVVIQDIMFNTLR